jgi:hypothetical protein
MAVIGISSAGNRHFIGRKNPAFMRLSAGSAHYLPKIIFFLKNEKKGKSSKISPIKCRCADVKNLTMFFM